MLFYLIPSLLCIGSFFAIILFVIFSSLRRRGKVHAQLSSLAQSLRLNFDTENYIRLFYQHKAKILIGKKGTRTVKAGLLETPYRKRIIYSAFACIHMPEYQDKMFGIARKNLPIAALSAAALPDFKSGNAAFDQAFLVHANDPSFASNKLTTAVQTKIANLFQIAHGELIFENQFLWYVFGNELLNDADRQKLAAVFQELWDLADVF
jgi:hypothetical protein